MTSASGGRHTTTLTWRLWSRRRAYPIPFQERAVARFARYVYDNARRFMSGAKPIPGIAAG